MLYIRKERIKMNNTNEILTGVIIGLGALSAYLLYKNQYNKKTTSEEKMNLFWIGVELAQDNLELSREIADLKKKIGA